MLGWLQSCNTSPHQALFLYLYAHTHSPLSPYYAPQPADPANKSTHEAQYCMGKPAICTPAVCPFWTITDCHHLHQYLRRIPMPVKPCMQNSISTAMLCWGAAVAHRTPHPLHYLLVLCNYSCHPNHVSNTLNDEPASSNQNSNISRSMLCKVMDVGMNTALQTILFSPNTPCTFPLQTMAIQTQQDFQCNVKLECEQSSLLVISC
jgi:hypothetical protein